MPSVWLLSDEKNGTRRDVLGLYNWDSTDRTIGYDASKAGLKANATYHAFDFWANAPLPDFQNKFSWELPKESCRIIAVREAQEHPVLVSTSRHVTQGIIDVTAETWNDHTLSATSQIVGGDACELRIAGLKDGNGWKLASARVSAADQAVGATITPIHSEEGWLRLVIRSKESRPVQWSVEFTGHPKP